LRSGWISRLLAHRYRTRLWSAKEASRGGELHEVLDSPAAEPGAPARRPGFLADRLVISPKTADHHIQHIYAKIGVSTRAAAALWAIQHHVVR